MIGLAVFLAALVPPPRTHRHRYFGVLAPHSPLRALAVTLVQASPALTPTAIASESATTADSEVISVQGSAGHRRHSGKITGDDVQAPCQCALLLVRTDKPGSTKCSPWCVPWVVGKCASSLSSSMATRWARFWSTSAWMQTLPE